MADDLDLDALQKLADDSPDGWVDGISARRLRTLIAELRSVRSQLAESQRENAELKRSRDYWSAIAHAEQLPDAEPRP